MALLDALRLECWRAAGAAFWQLAALALPALAAQSGTAPFTISMPFGAADSPSDYTRVPFALEELGAPSCRYQQVYDASEFGMLGAQGAYISWIGFRSDSTFGRGFAAHLPSVEILMGTTRQDPDGLSTTFLDNPAGDLTTVYSRGPLWFGAGGPGDLAAITLQTPFLYNPAEGNLLLEIRNYQPVPPPYDAWVIAGVLDAWNLEGDSVSRVYAFDVNAETGIADTVGLTTYFVVGRVPEPSTLGLLVLVGGLSGLHGLHKNRRSTQP
jgi:hypothetical protein